MSQIETENDKKKKFFPSFNVFMHFSSLGIFNQIFKKLRGLCRGLPPAMGTVIQLDKIMTLSLVLSQ